nr:MAG TPA: hypothetical protein [Caudoviricetes sp.]
MVFSALLRQIFALQSPTTKSTTTLQTPLKRRALG